MKIIFDKVYIDDEHVATIRFGQLIIRIISPTIIKELIILSHKLDLEIQKTK